MRPDKKESKFKFVCQKNWGELTPTKEQDVKFCNECKKNVYYCKTEKQFLVVAGEGRCLALEDTSGRLIVGMPDWEYGVF